MSAKLRLEQIETITGGDVTASPSGNLTSTDVQAALVELQGDIDNLVTLSGRPISSVDLGTGFNKIIDNSTIYEALETLDDYLDDYSTNLSIGTHTPTTLQLVIDTGDDLVLPSATNTLAGLFTSAYKLKVDGIENNAKDDQDASEVPVTAVGNLLSTDVQAALQELQGDIDTINAAGYLTITEVSEDLTPRLGGDLYTDSHTINLDYLENSSMLNFASNKMWIYAESTTPAANITSLGIPLTILGGNGLKLHGNTLELKTSSGDAFNWPASDGSANDYMKTDGSGGLTLAQIAASEVSNAPAGNLAATTVQAALDELQGDINTLSTIGYVEIDTVVYDELYLHGSFPTYSYVADTLSIINSFSYDEVTILDANKNFLYPYDLAGRVFIPTAPTSDRTHTLPFIFAYHDFEFVIKGVEAGGFTHTVGSSASFENIQTGATSADVELEDGAMYRFWYNQNDTTYYYQKTAAGVQFDIGGTDYDALNLVNYSTYENPDGTLNVLQGLLTDVATFNNTGGFGLTYADVTGKLHIPTTPTANHTITVPTSTIPASNDYEFAIRGIEDSGFKYSLNSLGVLYENLYDQTTVTTLDLLDSVLYRVWYDYSANKFYYYTLEDPSGGGGASSPLTTKGDLWVYTTEDARLGIGADDTTLVADAAEPSGMKWAATSIGELDFIKRSSTSTQALNGTEAAIPLQTSIDTANTISWDSGNNTRLVADETGAYRVGGFITVLSTGARVQHAAEIRINGVASDLLRSSSYIRNSGTSWDYWVMELSSEPFSLTATDYVEIFIGSVTTGTYDYGNNATSSLVGDKTVIWMERATTGRGPAGPAGPAGADGGDEKLDGVFRIQNTADDTKEIEFDASGISTGTTRTVTMPDSDVDLGDIDTNTTDISNINSYGSFSNATMTWAGSVKSRIDGDDIVQVLGDTTANLTSTGATIVVAHRPAAYTTRGVWNETSDTMIECFINTDGTLTFNGGSFSNGDKIKFDFHFEK